jgi:hypothetical protein
VASRAVPRLKRGRLRENVEAYLFIGPWLIGLLALTAGPMIGSALLAFSAWNLLTPPRLIGPANFGEMVADDLFWKSLYNTAYYDSVDSSLAWLIAPIDPLRPAGLLLRGLGTWWAGLGAGQDPGGGVPAHRARLAGRGAGRDRRLVVSAGVRLRVRRHARSGLPLRGRDGGRVQRRRAALRGLVAVAFFIGLDLGQASDYSALGVLERKEPEKPNPEKRVGEAPAETNGQRPSYELRHLMRFSPGTSYPAVGQAVEELLRFEVRITEAGHDTFGAWREGPRRPGVRRRARLLDRRAVRRPAPASATATSSSCPASTESGSAAHEPRRSPMPERNLSMRRYVPVVVDHRQRASARRGRDQAGPSPR